MEREKAVENAVEYGCAASPRRWLAATLLYLYDPTLALELVPPYPLAFDRTVTLLDLEDSLVYFGKRLGGVEGSPL